MTTPTQTLALQNLLKEASKCIQGFWKPDGELPPAKSYELVERIDATLAATADIQAEPDNSFSDVLGIGEKLSNVAFNWAQRCGHTLTSNDCSMLDEMRKQWDAARKQCVSDHSENNLDIVRAQTVAACQRAIQKTLDEYPDHIRSFVGSIFEIAINACLNVLEDGK